MTSKERLIAACPWWGSSTPSAEPAQVRQWVKEAIIAGKPGGGFSLRTTGGGASTNAAKDAQQMRAILKCIEAYIDAGLESGQY